MRKPNKHATRASDINELAHQLVRESMEGYDGSIAPPSKAQISLLMAQMGRKGGKIGGKRRLETMTAGERTKVAKKAAQARWKRARP